MDKKKYHISIEGEGTAEEILESMEVLIKQLREDYYQDKEWNNDQYPVIGFPGEWVYSYSGVLRTEVNEVNE